MKRLKVTREWLNWFHAEKIQLVTTIDNREKFTQTIVGCFENNQLNYTTIFGLIAAFLSIYDFLQIDEIRLVWSEGVAEKKMQFYRKGEDFVVWKENVLKEKFDIENFYSGDYEDSTELFYNYLIDIEGEETLLYKYSQTDRIAIYLWYNSKTNTTNYSIDIELRKSLFMLDNKFEIHLPYSYIEHNKNLITFAANKILNKIKMV